MKRTVIFLLAALCLLAATAGSARATPARHALLIGVSEYHDAGLPDLPGALEDVKVMERVLSEPRLGFTRVRTLVNDQATHTGMRRAFAELAREIAPGDFVYIHYSGHGSRAADGNDDEKDGDGLDDTWVSFGARTDQVQGLDRYDVLDDEINTWLAPLLAKAGTVILVSDSCHSATITRGAAQVVIRAVPKLRLSHPLATAPYRSIDARGLITVGAARDTETASEFRDENGVHHGLFTWFWAGSLMSAAPGETWRQVFADSAAGVRRRRANQTPALSGPAEQPVFTADQVTRPGELTRVTRLLGEGRQLQLDAGSLAGITRGSIYTLVDPEHPQKSSGPRARVAHVRPFFAIAEALEPGRFQVGDRLREREHAYSVEPLPVCVSAALDQDAPLARSLKDDLQAGRFKGYRLEEDPEGCAMVLAIVRPVGAVTARSEVPLSAPDRPAEVWILDDTNRPGGAGLRFAYANPDKGRKRLGKALATLAQAREIKALRSGFRPEFAMEVTLWNPVDACEPGPDCLRLDQGFLRRGEVMAAEDLDGRSLPQGTLMTVTLKNTGKVPYYACLLNIAPDGKIEPVLPGSDGPAESLAIAPGQGTGESDLVGVLADSPGEETLKLIASLRPFRADLFNQEGARKLATRGAESPMERLLLAAMSEGGKATRGGPVTYQGRSWGALQFSVHIRARGERTRQD